MSTRTVGWGLWTGDEWLRRVAASGRNLTVSPEIVVRRRVLDDVGRLRPITPPRCGHVALHADGCTRPRRTNPRCASGLLPSPRRQHALHSVRQPCAGLPSRARCLPRLLRRAPESSRRPTGCTSVHDAPWLMRRCVKRTSSCTTAQIRPVQLKRQPSCTSPARRTQPLSGLDRGGPARPGSLDETGRSDRAWLGGRTPCGGRCARDGRAGWGPDVDVATESPVA